HFAGTPRSVAFNAQWFRVAVDPETGEIRILRSVHSADAGTVMNPLQCRGQIEGGVAQALGATLAEHVDLDATGQVTTTGFRQYHLPTFADVPRTEVHFATTTDAIGPLGAKSMSESPFNPVAPALANALRDATGVRFTSLPLRRDVVYEVLNRELYRVSISRIERRMPTGGGTGGLSWCSLAVTSTARRKSGSCTSHGARGRPGRTCS